MQGKNYNSHFQYQSSSCKYLTLKSVFQEVDDFFEQEKIFLVNYYNRIKEACAKADKMTRSHKSNFIAFWDFALAYF